MTRKTGNDFLDREIDAALAKFAAVEPRSGLENRILANLSAQQQRSARQTSWQWVAVGAAATLALVLALSLSSRHRELVRTANPVTQESGKQRQEELNGRTESEPAIKRPGSTAALLRNRPHHATVVATGAPRLQQFPSPQPLSEQEKILAGYIAKYPEHAARIAEARTEELRRDEEEMAETTLANEASEERNQ